MESNVSAQWLCQSFHYIWYNVFFSAVETRASFTFIIHSYFWNDWFRNRAHVLFNYVWAGHFSLSPSLITFMKLTAAQWEVYNVLPAADMKYTWSAACNITKQTDKRSFWAAEVVYMLIMQPHCSMHRMVSVCFLSSGLMCFLSHCTPCVSIKN